MALEILHNRALTHENEQFRRVVEIIENTFDRLKYDGLLIGNPYNELYSRFRADAILFYNNGIVVIDFKDYRGRIKFPPNEKEFHNSKWYNESEKDQSRLEIKAGSRFINPFKQLTYYRNAFREVIENNVHLNGILDPSRVCIANFFSGPIEIVNNIPRSLPYYKIVQETDLGQFVYDLQSNNCFSKETSEAIKSIFPAETYIKNYAINQQDTNSTKRVFEIEKNVELEISSFLADDESGVLVLESMNAKERDSWVRFIQDQAINSNIPQIETWSHSSRISKRILNRANIQTDGIYSVIYGGNADLDGVNDLQNNEDENNEGLLEIIPIRSNDFIDSNALIIIHEAHLISRSLNQSELLRFGTGRLLEDIIHYVDPNSNRKIVFIGDPYSLTYGKNEDSALNLETLSDIYQNKKIKHYKQEVDLDYKNCRENLRTRLASGIERKLFNNLCYEFDDATLKEAESAEIQRMLTAWFGRPFDGEPNNAVLFFSKKDCQTTNEWIKKHCLKNGERLAVGDLLIANNNICIPDDTGFQKPKKIINGMYFTVRHIHESVTQSIKIKQSQKPIKLTFTKLSVKCLSFNNTPEIDLWILDNYFYSEGELSREERISFRVYISQKINSKKNESRFQDSKEYGMLLEEPLYQELPKVEKDAVEMLIKNYNLPKEKKECVKASGDARDILAQYNKLYTKHIFDHLRETDPFINALFAKYGWAITVHKGLGASYKEVVIKGYRKENDGIANDDYFRWLYSAVSSTEAVSINAPQRIDPLMNCIFEDNSAQGTAIKTKPLLIFNNYSVETQFTGKLQLIDNSNVMGAICEISKKLEPIGYLLESTKRFSDYLTKVFYSAPQSAEKLLVLNIDNKGAKDNFAVGGIRIDKSDNTNDEFIRQCIVECFADNQHDYSLTNGSDCFPTDFREDIYTTWLNRCKELDVDLKIIQSHNNQDIFKGISGDETITFRVWYGTSEQSHTKGFLTKIEVLEKTSEPLMIKMKESCIGITE